MYEKIALLGKEAARQSRKKKYHRPTVMPPRKSSQSRTFKVKKKKDKKDANKALHESSGNVQSPHRYGRKVERKKTDK
tara:strand:+ start:369 stop:602 length:234 start_codon:yes stop_codon:yes gene_type:complete